MMNLLSPAYLAVIGCVSLIYQILPRNFQLPFVALCCAFFLYYVSPWSFTVLMFLVAGSYWLGNLKRNTSKLLWSGIAGLVLLFFIYRYHLSTTTSGERSQWLLLGAAFYVLRTIHYLIEQYKGSLPPHNALDYLCYQLYLPVIVVGPITRFPTFLRESARRRLDVNYFSKGMERTLYGYVMAVVLGEVMTKQLFHEYVTTIPFSQPWYRGYMCCLEYGAHLYFTFAGFSSIAIGFSLLLGIRIEENFHYPFLQANISQFWKRWHMTLSKWCRDYIYAPLAAVFHRPLVGIVGSMVILGLWHEWSMRYLLWGLYHGVGIGIWHIYQVVKPSFLSASPVIVRLYNVISVIITFNFVVLSFELTRSPNVTKTLGQIVDYLQHLILGG